MTTTNTATKTTTTFKRDKTMAKARLDDSQFRFSHGAAPRGRGSWAFSFGVKVPLCDDLVFAPADSTFSEARRWVLAQARERGFSGTLFVQP